MQIVFQNPDSALNRRHSVRRLISRPLKKLAGLSGGRREERLLEIIRSVRMEQRHLPLRPAQLSGGLKQRVAIARAFAGDAEVLVCDEPTSALDVSVQAAILNLLADLQGRERATYLFISHDLGVVRYLADRIAVLYLGRVMEYGDAETVFAGPHHPYTEALLSAVPSLDSADDERIRLSGDVPSLANPPSGCVFHTRCPRRLASGICESSEPPLVEVEPGHLISCHIPPFGAAPTAATSHRSKGRPAGLPATACTLRCSDYLRARVRKPSCWPRGCQIERGLLTEKGGQMDIDLLDHRSTISAGDRERSRNTSSTSS